MAIFDEPGAFGLALAVETLTLQAMARLRLLAGCEPVLALTRWRAASLGLVAIGGSGVITFSPCVDAIVEALQAVSVEPGGRLLPFTHTGEGEGEADAIAVAAVRLTKLAALLPTVVVALVDSGLHPDADWCQRQGLLLLRASSITDYQRREARALRLVAEAPVPLAGAPDTRILAFRPGNGGHEHLAMIIGKPLIDQPVLVRLHSECFTGDLLGSLRCDCGDQLRRAIHDISAQGGGIVLYLAQEGRGIGLVNKLRTYVLQDQGYDTLDANEMLGFEADERLYLPAVEMLRQLGINRVRLMTNNPDKVDQIVRCGIEVVERVPHVIPSNDHNQAYLRTKALRGGHLF